jgi:diguanylate cyclase (GGDEF)-like protein/PAS domain S-box-containing protein
MPGPPSAPVGAPKDASLTTFATVIVVVASLLLPPSVYGVVAYSNLIGDMASDSRVISEVVLQIADEDPETWPSKAAVIESAVKRIHQGEPGEDERLIVFEGQNRAITTIGAPPSFPHLLRTEPIARDGVPIGRVEVQRSLRPAIISGSMLALFGLALAIASFITLRVIPLRQARRVTEALRARDHSLAVANTVLTAATEGSLDAILIVDEHAHVTSYNQRFVDMWDIPRDVIEARVHEPVLATVTSRTADPEGFYARVKHLYEHPEEESQDRFDTKDGRIIDRYSKTLYGPNHEYLGRVWFFRDVTEREQAAGALKQSEARFKAIFDHARDGIALADAKTKKVFVGNKTFCDMVGYSHEELSALNIADFHSPETMAEVARGFERQLRGETESVNDLPVMRKDGSIFYADISVAPVELGGRQYLLGVFHDVSERKIADDRVKFANTLLQAEIENAPDGVFVVHSDPPDLSFNRIFLEMCSIPPDIQRSGDSDKVLAAVLPQLKNPEDFDRDVKQLRDDPDTPIRFREAEFKDGRTIEYFGNGIKDESGAVMGRIWFFRDITERRHAAEALAQSEARFRAIFDNARDGIALTDPDTKKFLLGNAYLHQMLGYTAEEFSGLGMSDAHPAETLPVVIQEFNRHLRGDRRVATDIPLKRKDGSIFYVDINSAPIEIDGKPYILGIFRDATRRREAEGAVRRSEERYRTLVESTTDYMWEIDRDNRYTYYTPAIIDLLGYEPHEVIGKTPFDLMRPAEAKRVAEIFLPIAAAHQPFSMLENTMVSKNGTEVVMETSGTPIFDQDGTYQGYRGIERDITARKRSEELSKETLARNQTQLEVAMEVGSADALLSGDVEKLAREVTELGARASGCERVNVWLFNEDKTELRCIDLYEASLGKHSAGMVLSQADFGDEIATIVESKYVDADDPLTDPRTKGYVEAYIKPLRITAMLDVVIQASGQTFGLLCFEHVDKPHHWERDEIAFATQLADKIGISLISRKRREAEAELRQRDALLHAVAVSATDLLTAPSIDDAIPRALAMVGKALQVDRVIVLERLQKSPAVPILRYVWHAPGVKVLLDRGFFDNPLLWSPEIVEWRSPLNVGRVVKADLQTAPGDVRKVMELLENKSTLIVPITVGGRFWGQIGFDNCKSERSWPDFEIDIITTLGDLIGNAIQRDRYVTEITNANRIVQNTPTILYRLRGEPSLPMIYISQNVKLFGYEPAMLVESPHLYQELIHPDDIEAVREKQAQLLESDSPRGAFEFRMLTSLGDYRWLENRYSQIRDAAGRLTEIEGLLIDITERKIAEEKISQLARTDPLTGLANRNTFIERLQQSFVGARHGAPSFALLYIDLDRFKDINDTLGHPVGDSLLIEVSERIKHCIRDTDLAGRLGGDEFAILQAELSESADAGTLADKIRDALAKPIRIDSNTLQLTVSIGIAVYGSEAKVAEELLAQADIALYRAKEEGRDQYRFHTEELDIEVREQVELANELRGALSRDEFDLHYQPQVELSSNRIVGMEALLRWRHPIRGVLSPSAFLPVAERTGTIAAIGRWVLDRACAQMHRWREHGCAPAILAVNISSSEIKVGDEFIEFVRATLAKWGLTPQDLELDVTESMLARATLTQNDVLERLQQIGVKISIDDFGMKYSSLDYLRTYRVNRLKIPRSLTSTAAHNPESAAMVRAIVGIARELNIEVIAQGVESEREWSFLTATSPVNKVQGYFYSEPVTAEHAEELLRVGRLKPAHRATARNPKATAK